MTTAFRNLIFILAVLVAPGAAMAQWFDSTKGLDPQQIFNPPPDAWLTYSGDYSGRRYSPLTQLNQSNVKNLSLAWATHVVVGPEGPVGAPPVIVGGTEQGVDARYPVTVKGAILQVGGILYVTSPDNAWALDARDGHEIWHYYWKTKGGTHTGNRGVGMWHNWVYLETPDNYLLCLDAKTGKERWRKEIASFDLQYFSSMSPIVVGNHLLVGTGDDMDEPGMLQSYDPDTGDLQWRFYTVPMKKGEAGAETWANIDAAAHGGGNVWAPGSYDPETHLYIFGTGNPSPAYTSQTRGPGDNLYTCALLAVNVDTGKLGWWFQTSPHDTHDYDSAQTPVLFDGEFNGKPRKLVATLARNGFFFTLDRVTGEHLVTSKITDTVNWDMGIDKRGEPIRNPAKDYDIGGAIVSPNGLGVTNWTPQSYDPVTKLFYAHVAETYSIRYLGTLDPKGAMGLTGVPGADMGSRGNRLVAVDYKTGKIVWSHRYAGVGGIDVRGDFPGLLTTAGKLLFATDPNGDLVARDPLNGKPLWYAKIHPTSAAETYMLDGHQYILVGAGDMVYAFVLN
jgi:alcohol dehydrogenase (cytochrome c)